jgi:hypothetical protein
MGEYALSLSGLFLAVFTFATLSWLTNEITVVDQLIGAIDEELKIWNRPVGGSEEGRIYGLLPPLLQKV